MTVGERIAARRKDLNMTQEELARKLGYKSRSSVNKIELSWAQVSKCSGAFGQYQNCKK